MMINYSFIIPHKNSPILLKRCLDSIPIRRDIEVIVIDDDSSNVDWNLININQRENTKLIITHEGKGAGYVRNVGMGYARGKWILFADCDDYYLNGFIDVLDKYKDKDIDVLYFNFDESHQPEKRKFKLCHVYDKYSNTDYENKIIKYRITPPWNKMISKKYIDKYLIRFEEVSKGNDVLFSFMVGFFTNNIIVESIKLYCYDFNPQSITNERKTIQGYMTYLRGYLKSNTFYSFIGCPKWRKNPLRWIPVVFYKNGVKEGFWFCCCLYKNIKQLHVEKDLYVNMIKKTKIANNEV